MVQHTVVRSSTLFTFGYPNLMLSLLQYISFYFNINIATFVCFQIAIYAYVVLRTFRGRLHESGLSFNPDWNAKSIRVYMEIGFQDWNPREIWNFKMANINTMIAALFLSAFSALVHLNSCIKLVILRRVALKNRKRALLAMLMSTVARKQAMTRFWRLAEKG